MLDKLKKISDSVELEVYAALPKKIVQTYVINIAEYKDLKTKTDPESDSKLKEMEKMIQGFSLSDDTMGWLTWRETHKIFFKSVNFNNKTTEKKVVDWIKENKDAYQNISG